MSNGHIFIKEQDLVLRINDNVDKSKWDESKYYKFMDELCNNREYQKDAVFTALKFMCSGQYENTKQLAYENFETNENIEGKYSSFSVFNKSLPFSEYYTASLDIATGTGKSWVLYAIAAIMLAEKAVDQVLVLVPSITIETELTNKFKAFASNGAYNNLLKSTPPKIINGNESVVPGCICIENREAIYNNTRSSIIDSLDGKGTRTLVLSDEVHHIYYSEENEWRKFISKIGFKYNIGVSGTCYLKNGDYLPNVIYRYSLRQSIEEDRVKLVEYVSECNMPTRNDEKWQVIYNSHENLKHSNNILPLTLVITDTINNCKKIAKEFKEYLKSQHKLSNSEIEEKILIIHSQSDAAGDRIRLKSVDDKENKVEWIFSVSMLTEGWDVKRVFQIVPHEERAFNSKLLIAQVLGRGLRIPNEWNYAENGKPKVIIFNHAKWAASVKKLVNEVLEIEKRITVKVDINSNFNFLLTNVNYKSEHKVTKTKKNGTYKLFEKGYIDLPTDDESQTVNASFINIKSSFQREWNTKIFHKTYSIEDVALTMWHRFEDIPDDNNENLCEKYQTEWSIDKLMRIVEKSLENSSNKVITDKLKQRFLSSIGTVFRQGNSVVDYDIIPNQFELVDTQLMRNDSVSASSLAKDKTLFWTSKTVNFISEEEKDFFNEICDTTNSYKQKEIKNLYDFKTPQIAVIADSSPEKDFIKLLIENSIHIDKWIKSTSTSFYSIEYSWRKGEHPKRGSFNPDFFIFYKERIIVVEIKDDSQIDNPDQENIGKYNAAIKHFKTINAHIKTKCLIHGELDAMQYKFIMLTPKNFEVFFNKLKSTDTNDIDNFKSELDITLSNSR